MDVLEIPTSSKHHILATVLNSCKLKTTQNSGGKEELKSNNWIPKMLVPILWAHLTCQLLNEVHPSVYLPILL